MAMALRLLLVALLSLYLSACGERELKPLSIVSGSENKSLETLIKDLGRENGLDIQMTYLGSVDIAREMQKGSACAYDAVWPASTLWVALGDTKRVVKHSKSIMRSPVVFAVQKSPWRSNSGGWAARCACKRFSTPPKPAACASP